MSSPGTYERTPEHRERMSRTMLESWEKRKALEEKYDSASGGIKNLSRDQLLDSLTGVRLEIDRRIKLLAGDFRALTQLQDRQEQIEIRLEATGMRFKDKQ